MTTVKIKQLADWIREKEHKNPNGNYRAKMVGGIITGKLPRAVVEELNRENREYLESLAKKSLGK